MRLHSLAKTHGKLTQAHRFVSTNPPRVVFLGCGNIATAMATGLVRFNTLNGTSSPCFAASDPCKVTLGRFINQFDALEINSVNNVYPVGSIQVNDTVIVACKPKDCPTLLRELRPCFNALNTTCGGVPLLISVIAAVTIEQIERILGYNRIIRMMPNIAVSVGEGVISWQKGRGVHIINDVEFLYRNILLPLGRSVELTTSKDMDVATGLYGSGPAYMLRLLDIMVKYSLENLSLSGPPVKDIQTIHLELMCSLFKGVIARAEASDTGILGLCGEVSSKGGTTEVGLRVLDENDFEGVVGLAVQESIGHCATIRALLHETEYLKPSLEQ